jgi:hypothetical protein
MEVLPKVSADDAIFGANSPDGLHQLLRGNPVSQRHHYVQAVLNKSAHSGQGLHILGRHPRPESRGGPVSYHHPADAQIAGFRHQRHTFFGGYMSGSQHHVMGLD